MIYNSKKGCDSLAKARGLNYTYDAANLYHSIEYLQHDYSQLGQYEKADEAVLRLGNAVSLAWMNLDVGLSIGVSDLWGIWSKMRSDFRQSFESYRRDNARNSNSSMPTGCPEFGSQFNYLPPSSFIRDDYGGNMEFPLISEAGVALMTGDFELYYIKS